MGGNGLAHRAGSALLTLAAIGGAVCIALVLAALLFDITLILFKTGSMSPTIPAGSLAVVREVPATEVGVGDVVTVERTDALPVTHRVTSTTPLGSGLVSLTMRGDANPTDDAAPYLVSSVRLVLFSVPHLAALVQWSAQPLVLGIVTVGASALVTWAFWPRAAERAPRKRTGRATGGAMLLAAALVVAAPAEPGHAAVTEEIVHGTHLVLTSIADRERMADLQPGEPVDWQIGVAAEAAEPGTVLIELIGSGGPLQQDGLLLTVRVCAERWHDGLCSGGGESTIAGPAPAAALLAGAPLSIGSMPTSEQRWVLVRGEVASSDASGDAVLTLVAHGAGESVAVGGTAGVIAVTGVDLWPTALVAVVAVATGLTLAATAHAGRRRRT